MTDVLQGLRIFDSHLHIIEPGFKLVANDGYVPEPFTCRDYAEQTRTLDLRGGAVVSGSFQAFDQAYLEHVLQSLGPSFVGVTQLAHTVPDDEILRLDAMGVRALRFNLRRGGSETIGHLTRMASRVYELAHWHCELYLDAKDLPDLFSIVSALPVVSIDHLGLSKSGFPALLKLVEKGARVKASGFGRVDLDVRQALREISSANPESLMFGSDLPSTRAPRPFAIDDLRLIADSLAPDQVAAVLEQNATRLYRPQV